MDSMRASLASLIRLPSIDPLLSMMNMNSPVAISGSSLSSTFADS